VPLLGVLFLGAMVVVLAVILGPIIVVVVAVAVARRSRTGKPTSLPQVSRDGNWWWDGQKWVPIDQRPS
jgi:hypothetical protein